MSACVSHSSIYNIEEKLKETCDVKRIRINEFFLDYDRLRSGFVTNSQFFRALWQNMGVQFSPDETQQLIDKYSDGSRMNWRIFCDKVDKKFDPKSLNVHPSTQIKNTPEYLGQERSVRPLSPDSESKLLPILQRMNQFYDYQGHNIRSCYRDFDVHNIGLITESQFYRGFPGPKDITDTELTLLVRKYRNPENPTVINYLNLYYDLMALNEIKRQQEELKKPPPENEAAKLPQERCDSPSVQLIEDRIRFTVHKRGIRIMDFLVDYDKLRHDAVTESQFVSALSMAIGKESNLSRGEIQKLANFYRRPDGFISYREFCRNMDNPFHVLNLQKDPLKEAPYPPSGTLARAVQILSIDEESKVSTILGAMREQVKQRRINITPYFKDFDISTANTQLITPNQFARTLHFLSLDVTSEDARLLARKFADPSTGEVNYSAFTQLIDPSYTAYVCDKEAPPPSMPIDRDWKTLVTPVVKTVGDNVPIDVLMSRIRHLILTNRIRIKPFFEDFDTLRSGKMKSTQFHRCLTSIGLSKLGLHDITPSQLETLIQHYRDPDQPDYVRWMDFINDVDSVFTESNLERRPKERVLPTEAYIIPKPGTLDWRNATEEMKNLFETSMDRLRRKVMERRMLVKPDFQAFDKLNHGHVTLQNFRQLMIMLNMHLTEEEMDIIQARFANDDGFNYFEFLANLDPQPPSEYMYEKRLINLRLVNSKRGAIEVEPILRDTEAVMDKIKAQVYRRRVRLIDFFKDHDKLNHGRVNTATFRRALNTGTIHLSETEVSLIEDRFKGDAPYTFDYVSFCDEIEAIFATKNLAKDPLLQPTEYKPDPEYCQDSLIIEEAQAAGDAIKRIADMVRQRRIQLHPLFNDFDINHRMTVSQNQFRRVLVELDLASSLSESDWACLYKRFRHPVGIRDDINYLAFSDAVYEAAGFAYRMP